MLAGAAMAVPSGTAAAATPPIVAASVATKDGTLIGPIAVRAKQVRVKVGGKRCTVAAGTPLAALVALKAKAKSPKVGTIALKDYGACGKRPRDAARLYLTGIGKDVANGPDGWIYDVDGKGGSTSAADPKGPFAHGALKKGAEVSWRWCRISEDPEGDCGDALVIAAIGQVDMTSLGAVTLQFKLQLRRGADGDAPGALVPAPVGTTVEAIDPTGKTLGTTAVADENIFPQLSLPAETPKGTRIVVHGAAGVAPVGRLWPLLR